MTQVNQQIKTECFELVKESISEQYIKILANSTEKGKTDVSVIVPTFNERENILLLCEKLGAVLDNVDYEIVIVDDNSPDGTAETAVHLASKFQLKIIKRFGFSGLGSAVVEGFKQAEGKFVGVIDADFQHPPEILEDLVAALQDGADIAVASRNIKGGGVDNWSFSRKLISKGATLMARPLVDVKDPMSGCFMLKKEILQDVSLDCLGYKILLEILTKVNGVKTIEVPYIFRSRQNGNSKLNYAEYFRYLLLLGKLYLSKIRTRRSIRMSSVNWSESGPEMESFEAVDRS